MLIWTSKQTNKQALLQIVIFNPQAFDMLNPQGRFNSDCFGRVKFGKVNIRQNEHFREKLR